MGDVTVVPDEAASFQGVREAIETMMAWEPVGVAEHDQWYIPKVAGEKALAKLAKMEAAKQPPPKILTEDGGVAFTWEMGACKIYEHFDVDGEMDGYDVIWRSARRASPSGFNDGVRAAAKAAGPFSADAVCAILRLVQGPDPKPRPMTGIFATLTDEQ